jgi:REP element-mobilizing transposase RayT
VARPLRLEFAGAIYHITARGNGKAAIFLDDHDRERFLAVLSRVVKRYAWICDAYCLMGNHYHLLIETPRPNLAAGMRQLNGVYAQGFNQRHTRVGHVFGERFKSVLVEEDDHLSAAAAYIVNNPVRAGLCESATDWEYSSYRATAGLAPAPRFLTVDRLLSQFGYELRVAQARYRSYVAEAALRDLDGIRGEIYLGADEFIDQLAPNRPLREIPRPQWQPLPPPLSQLFEEIGDDAVEIAHRRYGYSLRVIADHLGIHYSTVGRRLLRIEHSDVAMQDLTPDGVRQRKT